MNEKTLYNNIKSALIEVYKERLRAIVLFGSQARKQQKKILYYFQQSDIYVSLNKLGNLSNTVLEAMAVGNCILMLGKDKETHTDESTERLVPDDVVIRINRQNIVNDLTNKLIDLINNPEKIIIFLNV